MRKQYESSAVNKPQQRVALWVAQVAPGEIPSNPNSNPNPNQVAPGEIRGISLRLAYRL